MNKISVIAYIALGSNKGSRQENLKNAVKSIDTDFHCKVIDKSGIYETKSFGKVKQDNFLNAVIKIETTYKPKELFHTLKYIERKLGRSKTVKWGPREIDLDLLFYNEQIYSDYELKIPHRGITQRDFVIVPLCDIAPDFVHPETGIKISDFDLTKLEKNIISRTEYKL